MTCATVLCPGVALQVLVYGLTNGAIIALMALGFTLAYSAVRTVNFAYGDLFALTTVLVALLIGRLGLTPESPWGALLAGLGAALGLALLFGALLNTVVEHAAFRPFAAGAPSAPLIASVGLSFVLYQGALWLRLVLPETAAGTFRPHHGAPEVPRLAVPDLLPTADLLGSVAPTLGVTYTVKDAVVVLLATGLALGVDRFLARTAIGRALRASAQHPTLAWLCGVAPRQAARWAFALGGLLAGAAAFLFVLYYNGVYGQHGALSGLAAFTAAALGGLGRPRGALVGGLLLGLLAAASDYLLAPRWTPVLTLTLLVVLMVWRRPDPAEVAEPPPGPPPPGGVPGGRWVAAGLLVAGLIYPLLDTVLGLRLQVTVVSLLLLALLAGGLNLLFSLAGLIDLGYAAFFAVGGYTAALLAPAPWRWTRSLFLLDEVVIVLILGAGVTALIGAVVSAPVLRLRRDDLAIATLAFGEIVPRLLLNLDEWTGGPRGIAAVPLPRLLGWELATPIAWHYLVLTLVVLTGVASQRLAVSRLGRAWRAGGQDEVAAASCGVALVQSKLLAFALSAGVAGLAGALFARLFGYVEPGHFDFTVSAMVLATVVVGGGRAGPGPLLGALLIGGYDRLALPLLEAGLGRFGAVAGLSLPPAPDLRALNFLVFGLALYLTVLWRAGPIRTHRTGEG
jgi:branched-chain amino acid transport system permease protein